MRFDRQEKQNQARTDVAPASSAPPALAGATQREGKLMKVAEHVVPIGDRLVVLAREFTDDINETYLIAHKALRTLLRGEAPLSQARSNDLREAVSLAAEALGIVAPDKRDSFNPAAWVWPQRPDLVL
jgi:hypothetical protein